MQLETIIFHNAFKKIYRSSRGAAGDAVILLLIFYSIDSKWFRPLGFISISLVIVIIASLLFSFIVIYVNHQSKKEKHSNQ